MKYAINTKQFVKKVVISFIGILLICTVISRTIHQALLPVVSSENVVSGKVTTTYILDGTIERNPNLIKQNKKYIVSPISGVISTAISQKGTVNKDQKMFVIKSEDTTEELEAEFEAFSLSVETNSLEEQKGNLKKKISQIQEECDVLQNKIASIYTTTKVKEFEQDIQEQKKTVELNKQLYNEGLLAENDYIQSEDTLRKIENEREEFIKSEQEVIQQEMKDKFKQIDDLNEKIACLSDQMLINNEKQKLTINKNDKKVELLAPTFGYMDNINVIEGNVVNRGDQIAEIIPLGIPYCIVFQLPESQADKIQLGQKVVWSQGDVKDTAIITEMIKDDIGDTYTIYCEVDEESIEELDLRGMESRSVSLKISSYSDECDCIVSNASLVLENNQYYVYIIEEEQGEWDINYRVKKVNVNIVDQGDFVVAVDGAITAGMKVVREASKELEDHIEVALQEEVGS